MKKKIAIQIGRLILVMFIMSVLVFYCIRIMPGDPASAMLGEKASSRDAMDKIRSMYGLDKPIITQYLLYVKGILHGDFGKSYYYIGKPVTDVISRGFKATLTLTMAVFPIAAILGLLLGVLLTRFRGSLFDRIMSAIIVFFTALPDVTFGTFLVLIFAVKLKWFPIAGWYGPHYLILPVIFVSFWPILFLGKTSKSMLLDEMTKPYVFMCRTRGMRTTEIIVRECLPNVVVPVATHLSMMFGHMLEGAIIAELLFNIPGLASCSVEAINRRDYPVIMTIVLLTAFIYTAINYTMEILQIYMDPRVKNDEIKEP